MLVKPYRELVGRNWFWRVEDDRRGGREEGIHGTNTRWRSCCWARALEGLQVILGSTFYFIGWVKAGRGEAVLAGRL